jgi:hypothetical protein
MIFTYFKKNWAFSLRLPRFIVYQEFEKLLQEAETIEVVEHLMYIFSSIGCINGSFIFSKDPDCYLTNPGLNMDECMQFFNAIAESPHVDRFAETVSDKNNTEWLKNLAKVLISSFLSLNSVFFRLSPL